MAEPEFKSVDAYIDAQPFAARPALNQLRKIIHGAVPEAEETISYKIPAYTLRGGTVMYFAGWKNHTSIYPANKRVLQAFKKELATQDVNKSTIRFSLSKPIPKELVASIAKFRAKEVTGRERPKTISKKSST